MGIFKKLNWFFRQEKRRYAIGISVLILTAFANLVPPRILGLMADQLNKGKISWAQFFFFIFAILGAALLLYVLRFFWRKEIFGGAAKLERVMRGRLFWHFLQMDQTFFQRHRTGDLMAHATNDINAVQNVAGSGVLTLIDAFFTGGMTILAMMFLIDWRLTLIAMIPMPFLALMSRYLGSKLHSAYSHSQAAFSRLNNKTQESLTGIKVIKTFNQDEPDTAEFEKMVDETIQVNKRVFRLDSLFDPLTTIIIGLTYCITIIYGGSLVMNRTITIGQLVSFVSYIGNMVWPMFALGALFNILERGSASYDRIMTLLNEKSLIKDAADRENIETFSEPVKGALKFNIDSFAYPDEPKQPVIQNINFTLQPGQTLGLVGRVGSGKTTIIQLLMREFDNYHGQIKFGDYDIRDIPLDTLLNEISYVPQNNFLFSVSVKDNINFADPKATKAQTISAAKKSALHDDVMNFPEGYDTLVGENGVSLSGGQKQRMAIARALLKDRQILILDDALSAVDAKTETEILRQLKKERHDKTTIIAAHRLTSVMDADLILVLKQGKIVESGTHDELLAKHGWYAEMWSRQELEAKVGEPNE